MTLASDLPATQRGPTPLDGIRVLDFSHVFAGPFCTRTLADLGAEILHVETRSRQTRAAPASGQRDGGDGDGQDDLHRPGYAHRNKQSITLNLKTAAGRDVAARLAAVSDVLVENFSSGVMGRLELGYERLQTLNPRLIYVSMSGYGHSGPRRDWTSMNMNLQAYSGLMMVTGIEGDPPTAISNSWNDFIGGLHGTFEILQALAERADTGRGKNIDLAQFESSVGTLGPLLLSSAVNGTVPPRLGNRSTRDAPQGCYRCQGKDEWCTLVVQTDAQWHALAKAIGDPAWTTDPRFASALGRLRHHDEIDAHLSAWAAELPSIEVERRLQAAGVPAERMRRGDAIVGAPDAGGVYAPLESNGQASVVAMLPFSFSTSATAAPVPPPKLGQHTRDALRDWLGMSDAEVAALETEDVLT
jgi:crotonobetainyl-CoA:carnitine CoA-transferase CaiB-like acyl-CoA transferase